MIVIGLFFYLLVCKVPSGVLSFDTNDINELIAMSDLINLGQDITDDQIPEFLRQALIIAANTDAYLNQYSANDGLPKLKKAVAAMYTRLLKREVRAEDNVLITVGATEALHVAFQAFTKPGDEWIIIEPAYTRYIPIVKLVNGVPRYTTLKLNHTKKQELMHSSDWKLDLDELKSLFNKKTRGILLNNPNNPTGKIFTREELQFIADLVKQWPNTIVISDEAHEFMTYKPHEHLRIASFPDMFIRTVTIGTASKSFGVSGWRIGWVYGPTNLLDIMKPIHANTVHSAPTPIQQAIAQGIEQETDDMDDKNSFFRTQALSTGENRDNLAVAFLEVGMTPTIPEAGNCMIVNWTTFKGKWSSKIRERTDDDKPPKSDKGTAFNFWMMGEIGLVGVPMSYFYSDEHELMGEDYIRYCFHKTGATIDKAVKRIHKLRRNE